MENGDSTLVGFLSPTGLIGFYPQFPVLLRTGQLIKALNAVQAEKEDQTGSCKKRKG